MFKVSIVNSGIENYLITQFCVKASNINVAHSIAVELFGTGVAVKVIDI